MLPTSPDSNMERCESEVKLTVDPSPRITVRGPDSKACALTRRLCWRKGANGTRQDRDLVTMVRRGDARPSVWDSVPRGRPQSVRLVLPELPLARNELPRSVLNLIEQHFHSAPDVETLLLLWREKVDWEAPAVARELRLDVEQAAAILARMHRRGLLRAEGASFRFHPRHPAEAEAVAKLAELYPAYRVAIVALIYARPTGPVKDFSNAFRVRKED